MLQSHKKNSPTPITKKTLSQSIIAHTNELISQAYRASNWDDLKPKPLAVKFLHSLSMIFMLMTGLYIVHPAILNFGGEVLILTGNRSSCFSTS